MKRRTVIAVVVVAVLAVVGGALLLTRDSGPSVAQQDLVVPVGPEPDGEPVSIDATVFAPDLPGPLPAVLLAHGFGGSKADLTEQARTLAQRGYVVMTYSARGFGASGGRIHLNSPEYEVADAQALLDVLSARPDVVLDAPGDPRVGVAGGSYGGALALLLAGYDDRVDAVNPRITWHDLAESLFPQFAASGPPSTPAAFPPIDQPGVFKKLWAGVFFGSGSALGTPAGQQPTQCGRFAPDVCAAYDDSAASGLPTAEILALLRQSSPATVLDRITAPTLLVQGQADSLFPLSEGDANAAGIAATGTPVTTVWYAGGHDGGDPEAERIDELTYAWFDRYLAGDAAPSSPRFEVTGAPASLFGARTGAPPQVLVAPGLPGAGPTPQAPRTELPLTGPPQTVVAPAGGNPAQISSLPGLGELIGTLLRRSTTALPDIPGQSATFVTEPLTQPLTLVGSATVDLRIRTEAPDVTLFAKLLDVAPDGAGAVLPQRLVAPLRLAEGGEQQVTVVLPAVVREIPVGHRIAVVLSTTDQAYAMPADARTYEVSLAGPAAVSLPLVAVEPLPRDNTGLLLAVAALATVAVAWTAVAWLVRRRRLRESLDVDPELLGTPLVVRGLGKEYAGGFRAVSDVSFRVEQGQVLGLLGPNGAGKTTVLRMLMGLIHPTEGELRVYGHRVTPGAPVLSRLGAFVEGPGLLPFLSGRANLELYWRATGRPLAEAHLDTALEVAGLGDDVDRRVRTYSQGMRQRLAIAQAMLGLPNLLVLDEPTNGLDPPQIREMREVLRTYAETGRTVIVSSHLLAEVERTCTHVVVMNRGRVVAAGALDQLVTSEDLDAGATNLEDVFLTLIGAAE
ncbi:MAG: alpha/beta fold hydrolase [Candidatus Nanopelagicales bacterium]